MSNAAANEPSEPIAVAEPDAEALAGPSCEKCGFVSDAAACPKCGWYPLLGIHVEIDDAFEALLQAPAEPDPNEAGEGKKQPNEGLSKHLEVWKGLIPAWGWLLLGTTGGVVAAAIVARVATLPSPATQTLVGVSGLIAGVAVAIVAHLVSFVLCSSDDAELGLAHLIVKPLATWKTLFAELPRRLWLSNALNVGVTTALSSALIVGGIPYEKLLDWKFKAAPKKNLVASIAQQAAKNGDGDMSMEEAMNAFADEAVGDLKGDGKPKPPAEKPRKKLECLLIGYQLNDRGELTKLLLAADSRGKLRYVGAVRPKLEPKEADALLAKFEKAHSTRPFVKTTDSGLWLRPKFTARVTYTEWPEGKRPRELKWDELLDEIKMPW